MAKKFYGNYEGIDARRKQEASDAAMIGSGVGYANMPQEVVVKLYPKSPNGMPEKLNDTMSGIDAQIRADNSKKQAHIQKEKI